MKVWPGKQEDSELSLHGVEAQCVYVKGVMLRAGVDTDRRFL